MITTTGLAKLYGPLHAVDGIDLDVRPGDIYGFLGANGSGKTTTVRMLLGLVLPTSGDIQLLGESMPAGREVLHQVGALVEGPAFYGHLSGRANLSLYDRAGHRSSGASRRSRIIDVLAQVGLDKVGKRPVKHYSLGMRQRLGLANALLRKPQLLILDEPTNGLDPQGIHEIRDLLLALHASGTTVFLSSHLLAEVEQLCIRIGVLDRGKLVLQDQLDTLRAPTGLVTVVSPDAERAVGLLRSQVLSRNGDEFVVRSGDSAGLNSLLVKSDIRVSAIYPERPSLEKIVLAAANASGDRGGPR
jgi:ABC-type multidrug transport system ATPase subunit